MTDHDTPGVLLDVALARRLLKICRYAIDVEAAGGHEAKGYRRTYGELHDAIVIAEAQS